jgi:catechol 2,3-dioxygenase-like lactoylglutathione lyase family enzyme
VEEESVDWKLEVLVVPVSDVDRAKHFYGHTLGFAVDTDFQPNDAFRVVQVTPPGSATSIVFGK